MKQKPVCKSVGEDVSLNPLTLGHLFRVSQPFTLLPNFPQAFVGCFILKILSRAITVVLRCIMLAC